MAPGILRLHQFLSKTGLFKRKQEIWDAVEKEEITVNDKAIVNPQFHLKDSSVIKWKGKVLEPHNELLYFLCNKPEHYLCSKLTKYDQRVKKRSIFTLVKGVSELVKNTLSAVGRLDEDSCGLLIVTNDGDFNHKIAHPDSEIVKNYRVLLDKKISPRQKSEIERGVYIRLEENGKVLKYKTKPARVYYGRQRGVVVISLTEGKKREVRRIFEAVECKVTGLQRVSIGGLKLEDVGLHEGLCKKVTKEYLEKRIFSKD